MAATAILELDERAGIMDGIIGAVLGFVGTYICVSGVYGLFVWAFGQG